MARYTGPDGEVDADQLDEDRTFQPSGNVGKKGEWVGTFADGKNFIVDPAFFQLNYKQIFPRIAG